MLRPGAWTLAALLLLPLAAPLAAALPDLGVAAARLDALVRTRPETLADMVRAQLEDPAQPEETAATVYVLRTGEAQGQVLQLGEHEVRVQPWSRPPNWFVAVRFDESRYGVAPGFPEGDIELAAPMEGALGVGVYQDAQPFAFQDPGRPGLSVTGLCESDGGRFEIVELHYGYVGHVDRLGAVFESPGCRGFVVYRRGRNDWTGEAENGAPTPPPPVEVPPTLPEVIAAFAAEDPQLQGLQLPESPTEPHMTAYARGEDWVARGRRILLQADGAAVEWNNGWSPEGRAVDLRMRRPRPDGLVDVFEVALMSPLQEEIRTRVYPWAGNFPFQAGGYPGIRVGGLGNGCATASGIFRVLELKRAPDGRLLRFAADYEQHCEQYGPPMEGFVVYRAP